MEMSERNGNDRVICLPIGRFRGGAEGAAGPPFFLYFENCFETFTLLYCCMSWKVKFSFGAGGRGEGGRLGPLFLNFLDPPLLPSVNIAARRPLLPAKQQKCKNYTKKKNKFCYRFPQNGKLNQVARGQEEKNIILANASIKDVIFVSIFVPQEVGKTLDYVSCFALHFFRALRLPECFTTEQTTAEASLFVKYYCLTYHFSAYGSRVKQQIGGEEFFKLRTTSLSHKRNKINAVAKHSKN